MKLYNPITTVVEKPQSEYTTKYFLHAVTFMRSNMFKADGYEIHQNGSSLNVDLIVSMDEGLEPLNVMSPIVHNVDLGQWEGKGTKINVVVKFADRVVGKGTTDDDHASEDGKPEIPFIND